MPGEQTEGEYLYGSGSMLSFRRLAQFECGLNDRELSVFVCEAGRARVLSVALED